MSKKSKETSLEKKLRKAMKKRVVSQHNLEYAYGALRQKQNNIGYVPTDAPGK